MELKTERFEAKPKEYKVYLGYEGELVVNNETGVSEKCRRGKEFVVEDDKGNKKVRGLEDLCDEFEIDSSKAGHLVKDEVILTKARPYILKVTFFDEKNMSEGKVGIRLNENERVIVDYNKGQRLAFKEMPDKRMSKEVVLVTERELMRNFYNLENANNNKNKERPRHIKEEDYRDYHEL